MAFSQHYLFLIALRHPEIQVYKFPKPPTLVLILLAGQRSKTIGHEFVKINTSELIATKE